MPMLSNLRGVPLRLPDVWPTAGSGSGPDTSGSGSDAVASDNDSSPNDDDVSTTRDV